MEFTIVESKIIDDNTIIIAKYDNNYYHACVPTKEYFLIDYNLSNDTNRERIVKINTVSLNQILRPTINFKDK
jgi:hypothetical protein